MSKTPLQAFYARLDKAEAHLSEAAAIMDHCQLYADDLTAARQHIKDLRESVSAKWEPCFAVKPQFAS